MNNEIKDTMINLCMHIYIKSGTEVCFMAHDHEDNSGGQYFFTTDRSCTRSLELSPRLK